MALKKSSTKVKRVDGRVILPEGYKPSADEAFMNELHEEYFRQKLNNWKNEILDATKETIQYLQEESEKHPDAADQATSESERALELRTRDRQRKLVSKIDQAIYRLEHGDYGYCIESGEPIGVARLDARPIATLSLEAQEQHEKRERVFKDS